MKDDVKVKVPNGTPKILITLDGFLNWDGVLKSGGRPEGDHATHLRLDRKTYHTNFSLEMFIGK